MQSAIDAWSPHEPNVVAVHNPEGPSMTAALGLGKGDHRLCDSPIPPMPGGDMADGIHEIKFPVLGLTFINCQ